MDERDHPGEPPRPDRPDDDPGLMPAGLPEDDFDADAEMARLIADIEAGRERVPEPWELEGAAISISLGDACDVDPALIAAICGPDGLGGQSPGAAFGQGRAADALRPGPVLGALTEQAVSDVAVLSDDQLAGALRAAGRIENRAAWQQTVLVAEFARRRAAQAEEARARKVPKGRRPGEFPAEELAIELVTTNNWADARIASDLALTARLPKTLAGMAAGLISGGRADTIASCTASLTDADAARADEILAAAAPGLRPDQLYRKAAALEMKLNPEAVKARKEHAKKTRQRVEVRREDSGNASIAGRELDTADALASKAYIDALAVRIRNSGLAGGTLSAIRARVLTELLQGRNPLNLIRPPATAPSPDGNGGGTGADGTGADIGTTVGGSGAGFRDPDDPGPEYPADPDDYDYDYDYDYGDLGPSNPGPGYAGPDGAPAWTPGEAEDASYEDPTAGEPGDLARRRGPLRPGEPTPPPANLNLIVPVGSLLGWSTAPAQAGGFGLLDPEETRALAAAASRHPRTRWSMTLVDAGGRATAHGRARGQHPWKPPPPGIPPHPGTTPTPNAAQAAQLGDLIRALKITFEPIAGKGNACDHRHAEDRYTPSRKLRDLIRARTDVCDAPGCGAQAVYCDCDHTVPYPEGLTDQCNLGPKCRRHHRCKQAPGWRVEQPEPGVVRWTLPSGRTHTTTPTSYDT